MPPSNFTTITIPKQLLERIKRARALLAANGLDNIPEGAQPTDMTTIGTATSIEVAIGLLEIFIAQAANKRRGPR